MIMLPINVMSGLLMPMIDFLLPFFNKGFQFALLMNPTTLITLVFISFLYLTLKTTAAKLIFLGSSLLISSIVAYFIYKESKKEQKEKTKKIDLDLDENFISVDNEIDKDKELKLTNLFKK